MLYFSPLKFRFKDTIISCHVIRTYVQGDDDDDASGPELGWVSDDFYFVLFIYPVHFHEIPSRFSQPGKYVSK